MSKFHTKLLFISAAIFNALVAIPPLLYFQPTAKFLELDLPSPPAILFYKISMALVLWLGWSYYLIARDPKKYRPFILFGVGAKLIFIVFTIYPWQFPFIPLPTKILMGIDLIYIVLFLSYYRQTATLDSK